MSDNKKIQFVYDYLAEQIVDGRKTASVATFEDAFIDEDEYNQALMIGKYYDVYTLNHIKKCTIRIVAMEVCRWDNIPERLWRGETNINAEEFKQDHLEYFDHPNDDFEFLAYYFEKVD